MAYVYRHIRLDKNVPFYIGIGESKYRHSSIQNRNKIWKRIVAKTDYEVEILLDGLSWEEACKKEIEFIKLYGRIDRNTGTLANMTDGGDGNLGLIHSAEVLQIISNSSKNRTGYWKGKKMSKEHCEKLSRLRKGIPNIKSRGRPLPKSTIEAVRLHSYGNKYHLGKKHTEESKKKMSDAMKGKISKGRKQVSQYTLDGVFVKTFSSLSEAKKETNSNDIYMVCKGKRNYSNGFLWRYGNSTDSISRFKKTERGQPIIQLSLNDEYVCEYNSIKEASIKTGFNPKSISRALNKEGNKAFNYKWKIKK